MQHYRAYMIGRDGHIPSAVDLQCDNDGEAEAQAEQFCRGCDVELWQGGRQIAVFENRPE